MDQPREQRISKQEVQLFFFQQCHYWIRKSSELQSLLSILVQRNSQPNFIGRAVNWR
jgi:hypothetical protein